MDEHERIFGPINLNQFKYLSLGVLLIYGSLVYLESKYSIPISIMVAIVVIQKAIREKSPAFTKDYINLIRSQKTPDEFNKWLKRRSAEVQSIMYMRKAKGLKPKPELEAALNLINEELK